jgi:3-methyladenine DNA glycosylase/8-oxoguanine DNA glycosylase
VTAAEAPRVRRVRLELPLDLGLSLRQLQRAGIWDPAVRVGSRDAWRATRNPDGIASVHYTAQDGEVLVEAWGPGASLELERAPDVLGARDDVSGFRPSHPLIAELARRFAGLRMGRTGAVLEALIPTVFEQKVIGKEARAGYARMLRAMGEPAPGPMALRVPPSADRLAHTPYWAFHPFALERRRAETVIRCAGRAAWLEQAAELDATAALQRLRALPGVGDWTAAEVAVVALGDSDAVSVGDYHLPGVVSWALAGHARGDDAMMLELLEPYRGHRARVIRLLLAGGVGPPRRGPRLPLRRLEQH